jgi:hypothetical protein
MSSCNSIDSKLEKPRYVIFLDLDGVLFSDRERERANRNPLPEAFQYADEQKKYLVLNTNAYSNNYWSIVYAHHFSKEAIAQLMQFIRRIEIVALPQIVISSKWRIDRSPEQLRTIYFKMHPFAPFIIDKTPDKIPNTVSSRRAEEIQYWIDHSSNIEHYVIFDDEDDGLGKKFGQKFIPIDSRKLLSKDNTEKALAANPLTDDESV